MAGRTGSDADVSIQTGGSHLSYAKAEKIAFPEGQNDILMHIAGRQGRGRSLRGDLALSVSSLWWVFWAARGKARRGYQRQNWPCIEASVQNYSGELHAPCSSTSFCFNFSVTLFQRVNFKHKPRLFSPFWSFSVYQNITYIFFYFYGRFAFPCVSAVHRTNIWVGEVEFWFIGGECIISKFKRINLPWRGPLLFPSSNQTLYPVKHPRGHFCSRHQR